VLESNTSVREVPEAANTADTRRGVKGSTSLEIRLNTDPDAVKFN
jgi:hypothetical protein